MGNMAFVQQSKYSHKIMNKKIANALGYIQVFVAVGALPAGWSMITTPDGSGLGMSTELLAGSPFTDFFIPGILLFAGNGLLQVLGAVFSFGKSKYAGILGIGLGLFLLVWILVQVYYMGFTFFLQPLFFGVAIIEIFLATRIYSKN